MNTSVPEPLRYRRHDMKYSDIAAAYLVPSAQTPTAPTAPTAPPSAARRLRDALEPIATQGWWAKGVHDRLEAKGLGFFESYVWGRAASLGEPGPGVVVATFGVFAPAFLAGVYESGRTLIGRAAVLQAREEGAVESLAGIVDETEAIREAADVLLDATGRIDSTARPLFGGLRDLPVPAAGLGRLWRGAELVREHRGDGHLGACIAEGLGPLEMSVLTELWLGYAPGEYSSTRGYGPDAIAAAGGRLAARGWLDAMSLTPVGRSARDRIEERTDQSQQALVDAVGSRLDQVVAVAETVSSALVAAGAFPSDPRKRAAG